EPPRGGGAAGRRGPGLLARSGRGQALEPEGAAGVAAGAEGAAPAGGARVPAMPLLRFWQPDLPSPTIVALFLRVFIPDAGTALDTTYGSGNFGDGSAPVRVTGVDADPTRALDGVADFRRLDYGDASFDVALFDPPPLADGGAQSVMTGKFGTYRQDELL